MGKRETFNKRLLDAIRKGVDGKGIPAKVVRKAANTAPYESDIQQACIRWFQAKYPQLAREGMLFHIANEGIRLGGMGARVKREGVVKGVADLCLSIPMHGYGALYIEMKRPHCYQTPEQKAWQASVEKYGNKYVVCKSVEEFSVEINRYLAR